MSKMTRGVGGDAPVTTAIDESPKKFPKGVVLGKDGKPRVDFFAQLILGSILLTRPCCQLPAMHVVCLVGVADKGLCQSPWSGGPLHRARWGGSSPGLPTRR